jgi:5-methylcytosine-specific restriction endonuclease McrA
MSRYSLTHLSDPALLRDLAVLVARDRTTTAELLAHLAEVDARRLYLPAAYPSMYAWCVGVLRLSEESAFKRIHAARAARRFPAIFPMLADGRLHLSGVILLAPHLAPDNADSLLAAASQQTKAGIERLLAERFPRPDVPTLVLACAEDRHAPGRVEATDGCPALASVDAQEFEHTAGIVQTLSEQHAPGRVESLASRARITPLSPGRVALQVTLSQGTHDKLRYAQSLLGHAVPSGDLAQVMDRALDSLITQLEKRRFAANARTRPGRRGHSENVRHIPAAVRSMVWQRDGGQCTFVSESGHRCEARTRLEIDHIDPVARGGQSTPSRLRLRCRAHNQFEAERTYGTDFMRHKREQARRLGSEARRPERALEATGSLVREAAGHTDREPESTLVQEHELASAVAHERERATALVPDRGHAAALQARRTEVIPWLRGLRFRADEAQRALSRCELDVEAPLEDWVHAALVQLAPASARRVPAITRGVA